MTKQEILDKYLLDAGLIKIGNYYRDIETGFVYIIKNGLLVRR